MKKYIYHIFAALSCLLLLASCQQEEEIVVRKPTLKVVSANVIFGVYGGEGTIVVEADQAVSVTSERPWVQTSVSGNTITVTVTDQNLSHMSRYSRLTIKSGSDETYVTVHQYGEIFDGLKLEDERVSEKGTVMLYKYHSNVDVEMSSDVDWIHFEMVEDEDEGTLVKVIVDPNPGLTRFAHVSFTAGTNSGSAEFIQYPTPTLVSGWDVSITDGAYIFPNQVDRVTVTPPDASTLYEFALISKDKLQNENEIGEDAMVRALLTWTEIQTKMDIGAISSPTEVLWRGSFFETHENMPRSIWAVATVFDQRGIPTGEYYYKDLQVPDRGPVKQAVDGWDVTHSDSNWAYPTQTDVFTITPKAGYEDVKYIATVVEKSAIADVEDFAFTTFAMGTREEILSKVTAGELPNFDAGLSKGTTSLTVENMPGELYVVVVAFGDNQFYTGAYEATLFDVANLKPLAYNWVGKWSVARKNDKYDTVDTWQISIEEDEKTLKILGIEGFTDYTRYFAYATVDEEGKLVLKTQYAGSYEDSSRGHVDVLLSGQYDDTAAGKTYYTSSLNVTLLTGTLSEDGASADLAPGPINGYNFKNIQFYGRYKKENGSMSAVSWTAGPTAIPQTITRIAE